MASVTKVKTHFLADLPEEATLNILSNLDMQSLGRFCQVSHAANRLASDDKLWEKLVSGPSTDIKAFVASHSVRSVEEISQYIQLFIKNIQLNKKGMFICEFPFNPKYHISIGYKSGSISPDIKENNKEIVTDHDFEVVCYYVAREQGEARLGLDIQKESSESFFVTTKILLPQNQIENMELARKIGANVKARLEYLKSRSTLNRIIDAIDALSDDPRFQRIETAVTVTAIALSVFILGAYFVRNR